VEEGARRERRKEEKTKRRKGNEIVTYKFLCNRHDGQSAEVA